MTSNFFLITSLGSSSVKSVQVANETPMLITRAGSVSLLPFFLSSVLVVPNLSNYLLFINQIIKHLNYFFISVF